MYREAAAWSAAVTAAARAARAQAPVLRAQAPEIAKLVQLRGAISRMINKQEVTPCPTT
jgi:hypothetical protein